MIQESQRCVVESSSSQVHECLMFILGYNNNNNNSSIVCGHLWVVFCLVRFFYLIVWGLDFFFVCLFSLINNLHLAMAKTEKNAWHVKAQQ